MVSDERVCVGCSDRFYGNSTEIWCSHCAKTVEPFVVELSAAQRRQVDALAVIRGITPQDVMRQALASLGGRFRETSKQP